MSRFIKVKSSAVENAFPLVWDVAQTVPAHSYPRLVYTASLSNAKGTATRSVHSASFRGRASSYLFEALPDQYVRSWVDEGG
jgi:hypothetical protein